MIYSVPVYSFYNKNMTSNPGNRGNAGIHFGKQKSGTDANPSTYLEDLNLGTSIVREIRSYNFKSGSKQRLAAQRAYIKKKHPSAIRYLQDSDHCYHCLDRDVRKPHYPDPGRSLTFKEFGQLIEPHIKRKRYANCTEQAFMAARMLEERGKNPHVVGLEITGLSGPALYPTESHYFAIFRCDDPEVFLDGARKISTGQLPSEGFDNTLAVDLWSEACLRARNAVEKYLKAYEFDPEKHEIKWSLQDNYIWDKKPYF